MIRFYFTTSCGSCRKAKHWMKSKHLKFQEFNIAICPPSRKELLHMFELSDDGPEALISTRSIAYRKLNPDIEHMTLEELITLIQEFPSLLRRPIIVDESKLQIGFNEDDIRQFIPRKIKRAQRELAFEELNMFANSTDVEIGLDEFESDYIKPKSI